MKQSKNVANGNTKRTTKQRPARRNRQSGGLMRHVIAENLRRLVEHHLAGCANVPKFIATHSGLSPSQVSRVMGAELDTSCFQLDRLARVFHLDAYQLMIPGLDPRAPWAAQGTERAAHKLADRVVSENPDLRDELATHVTVPRGQRTSPRIVM